MENQTKAVASSKKLTFADVQSQIVETASATVGADASELSLALVINDFFGAKKGAHNWYAVENVDKATDDGGKLIKKVRDELYTALHTKARVRAEAEGVRGEKLKKVRYTNPSTVWNRIKGKAKEQIEGTLLLGERKDFTPSERTLRDTHPRWAEYARMDSLTVSDKKVMDALAGVIRACGHDPQKVDLKALGLKK